MDCRRAWVSSEDARAGDVLEVLDRDRGNAKAALALGDDERVGDQQQQCLAQRAGADFVLVLGDVFDAQLFARRMHAFDDVATQPLIGAFDQRLGLEGFVGRSNGGIAHDGVWVNQTVDEKF